MISERMMLLLSNKKPDSCILLLPGRDQHGLSLARTWNVVGDVLDRTVFATITPDGLEWYPLPNGSNNQTEAVAGLETSRIEIENYITKIEISLSIQRNKIALVGFSAGGVMANYVAMHSEKELAGVVCHAGAVLEPDDIPQCKHPSMPIILTHCKDDVVFNWQERYLPMYQSFHHKGYDIHSIESRFGGHSLDLSDIYESSKLLMPRLGY